MAVSVNSKWRATLTAAASIVWGVVNSCCGLAADEAADDPPPPALQAPNLRPAHWRKSSQWFGMLREHARVVLEDVEVFRK
jgi:hypothetical protein